MGGTDTGPSSSSCQEHPIVEPARIRESDLHAYIDGELSMFRRLVVSLHLRRNRRDAARLARYRRDGRTIGRVFGALDAGALVRLARQDETA